MAGKQIGFLLDIFYDTYASTIWAGAVDQASELGLSLVAFAIGTNKSTSKESVRRKSTLALINPRRMDGLISLSSVVGLYTSREEWADFYKPFEGLPLVSIGQEIQGAYNLLVDNAKGVRESLLHLIQHHGRRRIAYISGPEDNLDSRERLDIYKSVLTECSIPYDPDLVFKGSFTPESGESAVRKLYAAKNSSFDAVAAVNDVTALAALRTLWNLKIGVPDKISVIGFDDIVESGYNFIPLTTVRQPLYALGRIAVNRVYQMIMGERKAQSERVETELVIRRSCGCFQEGFYCFNKIENGFVKSCENNDDDIWKEKSVSQLVTAMNHYLDSVQDQKLFQDWASELVEALQNSLHNENNQFLILLERIIISSFEKGLKNFIWRDILFDLFKEYVHCFPDSRKEVDLLCRRAMDVIGQTTARSEGYYRYVSKLQDFKLQLFSEGLMTTLNFNQMNKIIKEYIGDFLINSIFIGCYTQQKIDLADSELKIQVAISHQLDFRDRFENQIYLVRDFISEVCNSISVENSLIAMNLSFEHEQLGFILFEIGLKDGFLYEAIKNQISSTMKAIHLTNQAQHYNQILEQEVENRVVELEEINRMLLEEIVERKRVESELIKAKEIAQITLESIGDGVITTDEKTLITQINPVASNLTGWTKENAVGRPLSLVFKAVYESSSKPIEDPVSRVFASPEIIKYSSRILLRNSDDHEYLIQLAAGPIQNAGKTIGAIITFNDVSHTEKMTKQLDYQASHDTLTGLFNRARFEQILEEATINARQASKPSVLCYIDLMSFRVINDSCGRIGGDEVLRQVGQMLHSQIRATDTLARLEADHFAILFEACPVQRAREIAQDLMRTVGRSKFEWNDSKFRLEASAGLVTLGLEETPSKILTNALVATDLAKKAGPNQVHFYEPDDKAVLKYNNELSFLPQLTKALEHDRFELYCQRIAAVSEKAQNKGHYEVLLRMRDENNNILMPASFLPVAEHYHLMSDIDRWVIKHTFKMVAHFINKGLAPEDVPHLSINLSGNTLSDVTIGDFIVQEMNENNLPPIIFSFEITETEAVSNFNQARTLIKTLKDQGCAFALDDFGKGWASFNYLKFFPIDYLKIDGSFIKNMLEDPLDFVLVETINHTGHVLGLQTVAEYVENEEIFNRLKEIGVNFVQGFYISRPSPLIDLFTNCSRKD